MKSFLLIGGFALMLAGCKPEIPDNCEGEYSFKRPYTTSHPLGRVKVGETITIEISLPFDDYNYRSDSIVNISRFKKVLCGFDVEEIYLDSTNPSGINSKGVKDAFVFKSSMVKLDLTPGTGGRNRVRFYLTAEGTQFHAVFLATPLRKGIFQLGLYNGVIEDAFCNASINCYWGNFTSINALENLKIFIKLRLPNEIRNALMVDNQAYFILVE
jgi:hypothetical protein